MHTVSLLKILVFFLFGLKPREEIKLSCCSCCCAMAFIPLLVSFFFVIEYSVPFCKDLPSSRKRKPKAKAEGKGKTKGKVAASKKTARTDDSNDGYVLVVVFLIFSPSFVRLFVRSVGRSLVRSFFRVFVRWFVRSLVRSLGRSVVRSFGRSFVCSFFCSFIR